MANVKISALPSWTGTAADLRWFVMNNSGENETFKYSGYSSPFNISNNTTLVSYAVGSSADTSINYGVAIGSSTLLSLDPVGNPQPGASNVVAVGTNVKTLGGDSLVIGNNVTGGTNSVIVGNNIQSLRNYNLGPNMIFGSDITNLNDVYRGDCYVFGYNFDLTSDGNSISIGRGQGAGSPTQRNAIHIGIGGRAAGDSSISIGKGFPSGGGSINIQGFAGSSVNTDDRSVLIGGGLIAPMNISSTGGNNTILNGEGNTISGTSSYSSIYNGSGNTISNGNMGTIIGTNNSYISTGNYSGIFAGWQNRQVSGNYNAIIGGYDNEIRNNGEFGLIAASTSSILGSGSNNSIIGSSGQIDGAAYNTGIYNAYGANINGARYAAILGGFNTSLTSWKSVNLGGEGLTNNTSQFSSLIAGANNTLTGSEYAQIFGGFNNSITSSKKSSIINSDNSVISSSNNTIDRYNTIIGGASNTITGGTNIAMIGCSGRTADYSETTYVENLKVHRQIYGGIKNWGTIGGTINIDCNEGNTQYFTLSATSAISFASSTIRDGATYILKIKQPAVGNHTASWSVLIKWPNGVVPVLSTTPNAEDILTFVIIGGEIYGNIQKLFS